jgi:hypothetical protein
MLNQAQGREAPTPGTDSTTGGSNGVEHHGACLVKPSVRSETIDWQRIPHDPKELPEHIRLLGKWIKIALPNATFECTSLTISERREDADSKG